VKKLLRALLLAALAAFTPSSLAVFDPVNDDTDIFLANPEFNAQRPNVLIILDNTANWNTPFSAEKTALVNAVSSLGEAFNVGLMMFTETGSGNGNPDGGYVKFAVRQMTAANKAALTSVVTGLDRNNDKSNGGKTALAMYEAFQYYGGTTAYAGANKVKRDYAGSPDNIAGSLAGNAFTSSGSTTYVSPIVDGCQRNFIIYISNGPAQDNAADLSVSEAKLRSLAGGVAPSTIPLSPNGSQGNWADEWARYMASADCNAHIAGMQNVITYTLDVGPSETVDGGQGPGWTALLKSMATNGKGKYFAIDNNDPGTASAIEAALNTIFSEVQAVNSVFASTTLPVSVNVRGTNLNQVYIGVFRPDADKNPRWMGNLKMYQLAADTATGTVFLADANGARAENASTGFISNTATSFWTSDSCFWSYLGADPESAAIVPNSCSVPTTYSYWSDKPDGDKVEKGGAAQRLRETYPDSQGTRKVYTCTSASGGICATNDLLSATPFSAGGSGYPADNANITAADLGAYTTYPVATISSTGTTATVQLSGVATAWPIPFFSNGNTIKIEGASPSVYNVDAATISNVNAIAGTFDYTISSALSGTTAVVTATNHGLNTGDVVAVTGASPIAYNTGGTDAVITRVSASRFTYNLTSSTTTAATGAAIIGKKTASALSGSGTAATLTIPAHNFGSNGSTVTITISGATPAAFNATSVTATIVNSDTLSYTTSSAIGGTANAARVNTGAVHLLQVGDLVTISGATGATTGYNCTNCAVTSVPNSTSFTYVPASIPTVTSTGTISITATRAFTNATLKNGTTNPTRRDLTATAANGSPFNVNATNWTVTVSGATPSTFNDTNRTITSAPDISTANFTVSSNSTAGTTAAPPNSGTVTFNRNAISAGNSINPVVAATGTILVAKTISATSVSTQTSATGNITAGRPSDSSSALRTQIINWVRGADNREDENISGSTSTSTDVRTTIHGDVLHSRPAVVNYNRFGNDNDIYAFYGANDGTIRALKGGLASSEPGINPGDERWAFLPREFFPKLKRLYNNEPAISSSTPRDYLADGPISVYTSDAFKTDGSPGADGKIESAVGDKVHLFFAFRRGGRVLYALDVSDPAAPRFLWRKTNADTGYAELGQTWSEPKVQKIRINVAGVPTDKTVLIFGGGYDPNIDDVNSCLLSNVTSTGITIKAIGTGTLDYTAAGSCVINNATGSTTTRTRSQGRAIFVVDATDGTVIWQAGPSPTGATTNKTVSAMTCAIPSDITVIDIDREGHADRGYVGDVCGNVWRIDISNVDPANWGVYQIAALSSTTSTDIANKRKFLFPPDVVFSKDSVGTYAAILLGSGDREHPFDTNTTDRFYMIKDRDGVGNAFTSDAGCTAANLAGDPITDANLFDATSVAGNNVCGFKMTLAAGEKNIGSAVTLSGTTFFNTNQPSATAGGGSCSSNLGIARQYLIDFEDASATTDLNATGNLGLANRSVVHAGGGFLPSPVPAIVELGGRKYEVVISGTSVKMPTGTTLDTRIRTYWYKEFE